MKTFKNVLVALSIFIAVVFVLSLFGQGNPFKAIWDKLNELEVRIDGLDTQMGEHTHDYSELTGDLPSHTHLYADITDAEAEVMSLIEEHSLLREPDYDSGWIAIDQDEEIVLSHNLFSNSQLVYVVGKTAGNHRHHWYYGGELVRGASGDTWYGMRWQSRHSDISIYRYLDDYTNSNIRVRIWKLD